MKVLKHETKQFYNIMCDWWEQHEFPQVPLSMLPTDVFVCYNDDSEPIYSVNVYLTNSSLCWLGWQISNKNNKNKQNGLTYLIEKVTSFLEVEGYLHIFTTSNTKPVIKSLEECDYLLGDENVNHYIKNL